MIFSTDFLRNSEDCIPECASLWRKKALLCILKMCHPAFDHKYMWAISSKINKTSVTLTAPKSVGTLNRIGKHFHSVLRNLLCKSYVRYKHFLKFLPKSSMSITKTISTITWSSGSAVALGPPGPTDRGMGDPLQIMFRSIMHILISSCIYWYHIWLNIIWFDSCP